ncbi:MAG TPA: ABC transporter permease, partial [Acidobacteriaceae bacterium]
MGWMRRAWTTLRGASAQDMRDELDFHLAMREQRNIDQGVPAEQARRAARLRFGNPVSWMERMREVDLFTLPSTIAQDLRFGFRILRKHPGFTLAAVAALAMGIGLNTVVFTLGKAVFARGVDAREADRMVNVSLIGKSGQYYSYFSYPDFESYRDGAKSFAGVIAETRESITLAGAGGAMTQTSSSAGKLAQALGLPIPQLSTTEMELATVAEISENYFDVLGESVFRGRAFSPRDHAELLAHPSALISENYWETRFQSDPSILGRSMKLNGAAFTVIGITPRDFTGTGVITPDFWIPLASMPLLHPGVRTLHDRNSICCRIFARLADGVTMAQAQGEVQTIADQLRTLHESSTDEAKRTSALIWPASPFARKLDSGIVFSASLIMLAVVLVLV